MANPNLAELGKPYRFQKGNPGGGRRGTSLTAKLKQIIEETTTVPDGKGKTKRMTEGEAIVRALVKLAKSGDLQAIRTVLERCDGKVADVLIQTNDDALRQAAEIIRQRLKEQAEQSDPAEPSPGFSCGRLPAEFLPPNLPPIGPAAPYVTEPDPTPLDPESAYQAELANLLGPGVPLP